jgi:riboflavin kinase/FMN adenylyltransferase
MSPRIQTLPLEPSAPVTTAAGTIGPEPGAGTIGPEPGAGARTSLVVGNFDGVHRGHAEVLKQAVDEAHARGLVPAVLTFSPHPALVLGRTPPPALSRLAGRARLMEQHGVARLHVCRFDAELASWSPERFAEELLVRELDAAQVVVGADFRFGAKRAGDVALLEALGKQLGFRGESHAVVADAAGAFSSTRVRAAMARGDVAEAALVLGRPPRFAGIVVHGDARGRTLGFPTANLSDIAEMLPAHGVYAVRVDELPGGAASSADLGRDLVSERGARRLATAGRGAAVMNIGVRPTIGGAPELRVEVHVLDADLDLYDKRLAVDVIARVRAEQRFASLDELKEQIGRDRDEARRLLQNVP